MHAESVVEQPASHIFAMQLDSGCPPHRNAVLHRFVNAPRRPRRRGRHDRAGVDGPKPHEPGDEVEGQAHVLRDQLRGQARCPVQVEMLDPRSEVVGQRDRQYGRPQELHVVAAGGMGARGSLPGPCLHRLAIGHEGAQLCSSWLLLSWRDSAHGHMRCRSLDDDGPKGWRFSRCFGSVIAPFFPAAAHRPTPKVCGKGGLALALAEMRWPYYGVWIDPESGSSQVRKEGLGPCLTLYATMACALHMVSSLLRQRLDIVATEASSEKGQDDGSDNVLSDNRDETWNSGRAAPGFIDLDLGKLCMVGAWRMNCRDWAWAWGWQYRAVPMQLRLNRRQTRGKTGGKADPGHRPWLRAS